MTQGFCISNKRQSFFGHSILHLHVVSDSVHLNAINCSLQSHCKGLCYNFNLIECVQVFP